MSESVKDGRELPDASQGLQSEKGCSVMAVDSAEDASTGQEDRIHGSQGTGGYRGPLNSIDGWLCRWSTLAAYSFAAETIATLAWYAAAVIRVFILAGGDYSSQAFVEMLGSDSWLVLVSLVLAGFAAWYGARYAEKKRRSTHIAMSKGGRWTALAADLGALAIWIWIVGRFIIREMPVVLIDLFITVVAFFLLLIAVMDMSEADTEAEYKEVVFRAMSLASISLAITFWLFPIRSS